MGGELPVLGPPESRSGYSVARLTDFWYIACASGDLGPGPQQVRILGTPLVMFRNRAGEQLAIETAFLGDQQPLSPSAAPAAMGFANAACARGERPDGRAFRVRHLARLACDGLILGLHPPYHSGHDRTPDDPHRGAHGER